ncbi:hypothetical protein BH23GEM10_BH23GEM10_08180 [soil metagenome]
MGDVAAFTTAAVTAPAARNATLVLGGPDAVSWTDVVRAAEQVLGRELEVQHVAPGEPLPGLPELIAQMAAGFESYESVFDTTATARELGVRQTTITEFLQQALGGIEV